MLAPSLSPSILDSVAGQCAQRRSKSARQRILFKETSAMAANGCREVNEHAYICRELAHHMKHCARVCHFALMVGNAQWCKWCYPKHAVYIECNAYTHTSTRTGHPIVILRRASLSCLPSGQPQGRGKENPHTDRPKRKERPLTLLQAKGRPLSLCYRILRA